MRATLCCRLSCIALLLLSTPALADAERDHGSYLNLSALAEREVPNDEFQASVTIERSDRSSALTQTAVNRAVETLAQTAKAADIGFETRDYQSMHIDEQLNANNQARIPEHWVTRATLVLKSQDLEALERFLGKVSSDVAIERVSSNLRRETRRALGSTLRRQAIEEFQAKAHDAAEGFGYARYEVSQVNINDGSDRGAVVDSVPLAGPRFNLAMAAAAAPSGLTITQGRTTVTVIVSGAIRLLAAEPPRPGR
ncbi:MAG: SIMPL domain-containing protein [Pseudomonadota bacterium]|nr:SIMPL domain-containing protein [Pseudomonadota bacterium]